MQHTEKYQLNLIDPSDEFLPDPLNQNMEAVEAQLQALDGKFTAAVGTHGQTARIAAGSYVGTGQLTPVTVTVDFKPMVVFAGPAETGLYVHVMFRSHPGSLGKSTSTLYPVWGDNSVTWTANDYGTRVENQLNKAGMTYYYVVIGVEN